MTRRERFLLVINSKGSAFIITALIVKQYARLLKNRKQIRKNMIA